MTRRPGRQGLIWTGVVLLALVVGLDLVRGRDSILRSWWSDLHVTRGEETRAFIQDFLERGRRR